MRILVDVKNLGLYSAGIAQYFRPLLAAWIRHREGDRFFLAGPDFDHSALGGLGNWEHLRVTWPAWLPRLLRHPFYDLVAFPSAVRKLHADFEFSPYHDVRLPGRGVRVMMIHDTCLQDLAKIYPRRIRWYYLALLRHNLRRADHVLTVSQTSRGRILDHYGIDAERVHVIYNACDTEHFKEDGDAESILALRARYPGRRLLFYPGGSEHRKNISGLLEAYSAMVASEPGKWLLLVTGNEDARWSRFLQQRDPRVAQHVKFVGLLDYVRLVLHYRAVDAVIYPTLCEGFGRVCLESMTTGAPLACSDIPVLREVAGDYPQYFDPHDPAEMAAAIGRAVAAGRVAPVRDDRFESAGVRRSFLDLMDRLMMSSGRA